MKMRANRLLLAVVVIAIPTLGIAQVRPTRPANPAQQDWYIVLFEQPNYRGNPRNYKGSVPNIGSSRLTGSITVGKGVWQVCEGANFTGRCAEFDQACLI